MATFRSIFTIFSCIIIVGISSESLVQHDNHFDFLVYAQVWPISGCITWEERSDKNTCDIRNRQNWTVHGIWPTQNGKIGPLSCNHTLKFDEEKIKSILDDLKLHWTNVHKNSQQDSFWEHEWLKHGTCAIQLEPMNTELKYFSKGLEWNAKYPISQFLTNAGITPGGQYSTQAVVDAIKTGTGGLNPALECQKMSVIVEPVLTQISLCFDKQLNLMGCDKAHGGVYGRCPQSGQIEYPKTEKSFSYEHYGTNPGKSGIIWGSLIGVAILVVAVVCVVKKKCNRLNRNQGYESM